MSIKDKEYFRTEVKESFNGYQVILHIDHQSFALSEEIEDTLELSKESALWKEEQLHIALNRLKNKLSDVD